MKKEEVISKLFPNNSVAPFFSGIGKFRGETNYSPAEQIVLNHFFTNIQSNVYCATDNMPGELWGLLMGQYARSNLTARDRFLQLLDDVHGKDESGKTPSIEDLATIIDKGSKVQSALSSHLERAGKFIETWGVKYGHASLRDSGTIRICFEGVSQRATKYLESAREGAYQEQSTRAIPVSIENLGIPFEVRGTEFEGRVMKLDEQLIQLYEEIRKRLPERLNSEFGHLRQEANETIQRETGKNDATLPERLWEKAVNEKTFDIARSLLPQNITTSLGLTLNTRRFQDQLTEWQSLESLEMIALGKAAQIEAVKISPTLMAYGGPSEFHSDLPKRRREIMGSFPGGANYGNQQISSKLVEATPGIEDLVLASILLNGSDGSISFEGLQDYVSRLTPSERREIAVSSTDGRKDHELHSKAMEIGSFTFERVMDIGAYRDMQRQRGDRQQINPYSTFGYHMPNEVENIGLGEAFESLLGDVRLLHDDLKSEGYHATAEYIPVMANTIRHVVTMDPVQSFYQARLRAQPAGADSYRTIARQEAHQVEEHMPSFQGLFSFDDNDYPLNRLPEAVIGTIKSINSKN